MHKQLIERIRYWALEDRTAAGCDTEDAQLADEAADELESVARKLADATKGLRWLYRTADSHGAGCPSLRAKPKECNCEWFATLRAAPVDSMQPYNWTDQRTGEVFTIQGAAPVGEPAPANRRRLMTMRGLIEAMQETGLHPDSEVRASMDKGGSGCGIKNVGAGCGVIFLNLDVGEKPAPGTWAWALEQMKAGKTVARDGLILHERHGHYYARYSAVDHIYQWQPMSTDFIAVDWQLADAAEDGGER